MQLIPIESRLLNYIILFIILGLQVDQNNIGKSVCSCIIFLILGYILTVGIYCLYEYFRKNVDFKTSFRTYNLLLAGNYTFGKTHDKIEEKLKNIYLK